VFRRIPKRRRGAYLWVAFFCLPGAGFVLSGVPGAAAATASRVLLAATVLHHSAFLIDVVLAAGLRRLLGGGE